VRPEKARHLYLASTAPRRSLPFDRGLYGLRWPETVETSGPIHREGTNTDRTFRDAPDRIRAGTGAGGRARQADLPSRAEAIRRLIEVGLAATRGEKPVRLSHGDKLIIVMLSDLFKQLNVNDGVIDPDFVGEAIVGGHTWGLQWRYPGIFHRYEDSRAVVFEVFNILHMWSLLESGYQNLAHKDDARVAAEAARVGNHVRFETVQDQMSDVARASL
jgi:hypothetical protein